MMVDDSETFLSEPEESETESSGSVGETVANNTRSCKLASRAKRQRTRR